MSPRQSIEAECGRRGKDALVRGCIALLRGEAADDELVVALGGPAALTVLAGREGGRTGHWPRVWAARGLLHAWQAEATQVVVQATRDDSWRVREMAAKAIAKHRVDEALDAVLGLRDDPIPRVRTAAARAVRQLTAAAEQGGSP